MGLFFMTESFKASMGFTKFVEAGRVALVNGGKYDGKIVVIANVVNQSRVLADNPVQGVPRQLFSFAQLALTSLKVNIPADARKLATRESKRTMNVFDRYTAKVANQVKNRK